MMIASASGWTKCANSARNRPVQCLKDAEARSALGRRRQVNEPVSLIAALGEVELSSSASAPYRRTKSFSIGPPTTSATATKRETITLRAMLRAHSVRDSRDPYCGGGRQSVDLVPTLALNDHASTDEADPGDDALDDPAGCCKLIARCRQTATR